MALDKKRKKNMETLIHITVQKVIFLLKIVYPNKNNTLLLQHNHRSGPK